MPHRFSVHSFKRLTFCDHCGSLLYGIIRQGLKCEVCSMNIHRRCEGNVANNCGINTKQLAELLNEMGITMDKTPPRRSKVGSVAVHRTASGPQPSQAASIRSNARYVCLLSHSTPTKRLVITYPCRNARTTRVRSIRSRPKAARTVSWAVRRLMADNTTVAVVGQQEAALVPLGRPQNPAVQPWACW